MFVNDVVKKCINDTSYQCGLIYIISKLLLSVKNCQISQYLTPQKIPFRIFWKGKKFKISGKIRTHDLQTRKEISKPLRCSVM